MTNQDIIELTKSDFKAYLDERMIIIPSDLDEDDFDNYRLILGQMLITSTNRITELTTLLGIAKIMVREAKRTRPKEEYEDLVDKRDILEIYLSAIKESNKTVSRLITLKQMELAEARLTDYRKG